MTFDHLTNYVKAFENSTVSATNSPLAQKHENFKVDYSKVEGNGRITVTEGEVPKPADNENQTFFVILSLVSLCAVAFTLKSNKKSV